MPDSVPVATFSLTLENGRRCVYRDARHVLLASRPVSVVRSLRSDDTRCQPPARYWFNLLHLVTLRENTQRYCEMRSVHIPICTVATAVIEIPVGPCIIL
jgi:hypothetical protein